MPEVSAAPAVGVVVIGRNEGERLKACLRSLVGAGRVVYVDSGSTDGSQDSARSLGVEVVELAVPPNFTAARARNAGLAALLADPTPPEFVQMVDGDCVVDPAWITTGAAALAADRGLAAVFGRLRERFPERSFYNRMCDEEWNGPPGPALSTGGIAMFRVAAIREAGGYAEDLIAGEEPELCLRMRQRGWTIRRLDAPMALHDAAMTRFAQWWRRAKRAGVAYAAHVERHGRASIPENLRQVRRIGLWGAAIPLAAMLLLLLGGLWWAGLALLLLYPLQVLRLGWRDRHRWGSLAASLAAAHFLVLAKFPQAAGIARFLADRVRGRASTLIEHKAAA